jgi:hypothetical protein
MHEKLKNVIRIVTRLGATHQRDNEKGYTFYMRPCSGYRSSDTTSGRLDGESTLERIT